jgi:hypothetical protein
VSDLFKIEDGLSRIDYDKYDPDKMEAVNIALDRCPMRRIVLVGEPSAKDLAAVAKEQLPEVVRDDFKTTVNKTEWRG